MRITGWLSIPVPDIWDWKVKHYGELAYEDCKEAYIGSYQVCSEEVIKKLKAENRHSEIEHTLKNLKKEMETNAQSMKIPKELAYSSGQHLDDYLHDIAIVQDMASMNRLLICKNILDGMGWKITESFQTIHNYIDVGYKILRKRFCVCPKWGTIDYSHQYA